jgi:hypothetical protein
MERLNLHPAANYMLGKVLRPSREMSGSLMVKFPSILDFPCMSRSNFTALSKIISTF